MPIVPARTPYSTSQIDGKKLLPGNAYIRVGAKNFAEGATCPGTSEGENTHHSLWTLQHQKIERPHSKNPEKGPTYPSPCKIPCLGG